MTTTETRPARNPTQASTRHITVDSRFARLLAEDFGISVATILQALEGEPQKAAITLCEWASRADDSAYALKCWAKKHRRGIYRRCRRHSQREVSRRPYRKRRDHGWGTDTPERRDGSLRGVRTTREALDRVAGKLGV